jgi:hypothetical protein
MCYTCGCKLPYEDHGDPANLVEADLERAGATETIAKAGTVRAKENFLELIRLQQEAGEMAEPKAQY